MPRAMTAITLGGGGRRGGAGGVAARALGTGGSVMAAMAALCCAQARAARAAPRAAPPLPASDGVHLPGRGLPLRVLWLGDSLAAGVGVDHVRELPAARLAEQLARTCHVTMRAVPGATVGDVLEHQLPPVDVSAVDVAIVQVGANDVTRLTPRRVFRARYREVLGALAVPTVCVGLPDIATADRLGAPLRTVAGLRGRDLDGITRREAAAAGAAWVDIRTRPPELSMRAARALLSEDRFHPGPDGYRLWAARIALAVEAVVGRPAPTAAAA